MVSAPSGGARSGVLPAVLELPKEPRGEASPSGGPGLFSTICTPPGRKAPLPANQHVPLPLSPIISLPYEEHVQICRWHHRCSQTQDELSRGRVSLMFFFSPLILSIKEEPQDDTEKRAFSAHKDVSRHRGGRAPEDTGV